MPVKDGQDHAMPSEPTEVRTSVSRPQPLRDLCWKQLLACVSGEKETEEMSEGEWDNQDPDIKTATHSNLSDSTTEIFQVCQLLHVSNGREKMHQGRLVGLVPITWSLLKLWLGKSNVGMRPFIGGSSWRAMDVLSGYAVSVTFPECEINARIEPQYPIFVSLLISSMWVLMRLGKGLTIPWHNQESQRESSVILYITPTTGALLHSFNYYYSLDLSGITLEVGERAADRMDWIHPLRSCILLETERRALIEDTGKQDTYRLW